MTDFFEEILELKKIVKSKEPEPQKHQKIKTLLQNVYGEAETKERHLQQHLFGLRIRDFITKLNLDRERLIKKQEKLTKTHINIKDEDKKRIIYDDIKLLDGEIRHTGKVIHDLTEIRENILF